jgi:hypothetical protein
MGRGKRQKPKVIYSYGRAQALADGVVKEDEVTTAPDFAPLFDAGQVAVTPGAEELLTRLGLTSDTFVNRHICGDWGDISPEDAAEQINEQALEDGDRILSAYVVAPGEKIWIITDESTKACRNCHPFYGGPADPDCALCHGTTWCDKPERLTTTVLLPDEY